MSVFVLQLRTLVVARCPPGIVDRVDWEGEAQIEVGGYTSKTFDAAKRKGFATGLAAALVIDPAEVFVTSVRLAPAPRSLWPCFVVTR